jgi:hypothetical protein
MQKLRTRGCVFKFVPSLRLHVGAVNPGTVSHLKCLKLSQRANVTKFLTSDHMCQYGMNYNFAETVVGLHSLEYEPTRLRSIMWTLRGTVGF